MNLTLAALALALTASAQDHPAGHGPQLGKVAFETSCERAAHATIQRGLGWLHSFEYEQAARTFAEAVTDDPGCAMARWGVAMSYYHPL